MAHHVHLPGTQRTFTDIDAKDGTDPISNLHAGKPVYPLCSCSQLPDKPEVFLSAGIGKIAAVADPAESFGKDVHKEAADEFLSIKLPRLYFAAVIVVFVGDCDSFRRDGQNAAVRYCRPVGVP